MIFDPILDEIANATADARSAPRLRWAKVVSLAPLTVALNGDIGQDGYPVAVAASSQITGLREGERVLCALQSNQCWVVSAEVRRPLDTGWVSCTVPAGYTALNPVLARREGDRVTVIGNLQRASSTIPTSPETIFTLPSERFRPVYDTQRFGGATPSTTANEVVVQASASSDAVTAARVGGTSNLVSLDLSWTALPEE